MKEVHNYLKDSELTGVMFALKRVLLIGIGLLTVGLAYRTIRSGHGGQ
ncbi:hypothetical protein EGH21_08890 [Halomicroarcula sp. F13]|uniref:Uncharacterized protein n=1 Tax=Haloarcula rubra TaxID=2487747 RepID=A0AAW4PS41_9EURY|nr:hypothetical protein [Halomicroarcula rubra]MBX0323142.1 hypothetical protein [Halomicroarcula rubra]